MYCWVFKKGTAQTQLEVITRLAELLQQLLEVLVELVLLALLEAEAQAIQDLCLSLQSRPQGEHAQAHRHAHGGEENVLIRGFRSQGSVEAEGKVCASGSHRGLLSLLLLLGTGALAGSHPKAEEQHQAQNGEELHRGGMKSSGWENRKNVLGEGTVVGQSERDNG